LKKRVQERKRQTGRQKKEEEEEIIEENFLSWEKIIFRLNKSISSTEQWQETICICNISDL
jgi:hypothetical protein